MYINSAVFLLPLLYYKPSTNIRGNATKRETVVYLSIDILESECSQNVVQKHRHSIEKWVHYVIVGNMSFFGNLLGSPA